MASAGPVGHARHGSIRSSAGSLNSPESRSSEVFTPPSGCSRPTSVPSSTCTTEAQGPSNGPSPQTRFWLLSNASVTKLNRLYVANFRFHVTRSIPSNYNDCDHNECRDQRKNPIKCFRAGLCGGRVERRHDKSFLVLTYFRRLSPGVDRPSASYLHPAARPFAISHLFMSAAMRSCPAFLMASDRFKPDDNFLACARASDARAAQSWLSKSLGVSGFISSSLPWRSQGRWLPADSIVFHRVGVYLRLVDKPALGAP